MARWHSYFAALLGVVIATSGLADDDRVVITPKQQKEAHNATAKPSRGELPWGKMNFIHTTDTHGWLEGHMNERNYGGDWGDFVSFVNHMREKADDLSVDLLVVDTGDLHDGNGLSDITDPKGGVSDSIFANIEYDLLTIGNHGVQKIEEARNIQANISKIYGDRYLTSNVYINKTGKDEKIGEPYRYFTTKHNTRVMAFGILFDDGKNDNTNIKIDKIDEIMDRDWFKAAMDVTDVDLYVILGHGSLNHNESNPSKDGAFQDFRRVLRKKLDSEGKKTPIQLLGGHTHIRDFQCYDELTSGLQSGKYGDTVGWLALDHFNIKEWRGAKELNNIVTPQRRCATKKENEPGVPLLDRRYLDWNVLTFMYHTVGPNETDITKFDTPLGRKITRDIEFARHALNLTFYLGCANRTWCLWCNNPGDQNIMDLAKPAALETVMSESRRDKNRAVILTGTSFRYDLFQGPFTLGDALAVVPYTDQFYYVEVNYTTYRHVINDTRLHVSEIYPPAEKYSSVVLSEKDSSQNVLSLQAADQPILTPGYNTTDDFGNEGDDTKHSEFIEMGPNLATVALQSWTDPSPPADFKLDLVVSNHLKPIVSDILNVTLPLYMEDFTTRDILPEYARRHWNDNSPGDSCPVAPKGS